MIGSFWNFCKACPSMPTDKFRSEYRSTYRWHEFQSKILNSSENKQVIRKAPQLNPAINKHIHHTANQITVGQTGEMEPLVTDEKNVTHIKHDGTLSEYKKNYRPFSHYDYSENKDKLTDKTILTQNQLVDEECDNISKELSHDNSIDHDLWYKEMLELRKKAEEYKHRGWGMELASENVVSIYNKQLELWNQVSQRSSLSALSLASTLPKKILDENKPQFLKKDLRESFRHHLQKTTGGNELDGLILSPSRDKLEPVTLHRYSLHDTYHKKCEFHKLGSKVIKSKRFLNKSPRSHSAGPISNLNRSPRNKKLIKPKSEKKNYEINNKICNILDNDDIKEIKEQEDIYLVKTPPEPTRVKSPEQIVIRSPEPVNWTVPLETDKSFIVTQNINPFNETKHKIDVENS